MVHHSLVYHYKVAVCIEKLSLRRPFNAMQIQKRKKRAIEIEKKKTRFTSSLDYFRSPLFHFPSVVWRTGKLPNMRCNFSVCRSDYRFYWEPCSFSFSRGNVNGRIIRATSGVFFFFFAQCRFLRGWWSASNGTRLRGKEIAYGEKVISQRRHPSPWKEEDGGAIFA